MNTLPSFEFTAFIGIDWADTKHDICIQPADSQEREFDCIAHHPEHIERWAHEMQERFGGPIAVVLELSKGPIVSALQKHDFFVLFPVNPLMLAKYRQAFKPSFSPEILTYDPSESFVPMIPERPLFTTNGTICPSLNQSILTLLILLIPSKSQGWKTSYRLESSSD